MHYAVEPGLYALGCPGADAPVLVTANYKLSFDRLRRAVAGHDAWILVLDTLGINVWCAAGKGTFGTDELVRRIDATALDRVVSHRRLVLPQLGAPGVAAHTVQKRTRFRVSWGPVLAEDLPAYLAAGLTATAAMRRKRFPLRERVALIPMELVSAAKPLLAVLPAVLLLGGLAGDGPGYWSRVLDHGLTGVLAIIAGVLAGAVLTPLLLPWLPGRSFALKGCLAGLAASAVVVLWRTDPWSGPTGSLEAAAWLLLGTASAAFLAMNFTGASTYTSLSGVRREMRVAVPLQIAAVAAGLGLWLGSWWTT